MYLECIKKYGAPGVRKRKPTTGSFLIWTQSTASNCPHPSVSLPCLHLSLSLLLSVFFLSSFFCLSIKNPPCSKNCQVLKTVKISCLWRQTTVPGDEISTLRLNGLAALLLFCLPPYRATKVKQAWSLQPTCITARSLQGECVCVWSIQSHNLTFSCSSEYLHMESIKGYWIDMQKHIGFKFKYSNVHARYD